MSDLFKRLKDISVENPYDPIGLRMSCSVAADEIERLQIELKAAQTGIGALQGTVERLRGMLQAFIDDPAMNVGRDVRERVQRALNGTAGG